MQMVKKNRNVAGAAEMRELLKLDIVQPFNVGPNWTSYAGAPFGCHIRWNSEGFGYILGTELEGQIIQYWIQKQLEKELA